MARKKETAADRAATLAYLRCFSNRPVDMMQLNPLLTAARYAFLSGRDPLQAMVDYADANGIEHNEVVS